MELGVRQAAHGERLLGPYSRFGWSHPGPALFYALLPAYELSGERSGGLRLGALLLSALAAVAVVRTAWRIGGPAQAAAAALLLAVYLVALGPSRYACEWGPFVTLLPLLLLLHLGVALACEGWRLLPAYAALGSALAQTHLGTAPACAALLACAAAARRRDPPSRRTLLATAAVLLALWTPTLVAELRSRPGDGNLARIARFFAQQRGGHSLREVGGVVASELATLPRRAAELLGAPPIPPRRRWAGVLALPLVLALLAAARRAKSRGTRTLARSALLLLGVATLSLLGVPGPIHDYLSLWVSAVGLLAWSVPLGWAAQAVARRGAWTRLAAAALAAALLARTAVVSARQVREEPPAPMASLTQVLVLTGAVEPWARAGAQRPLVRIVSHDAWKPAAGVVLELVKRGVAVRVEREWAFLFGAPLAESGEETAELLFGDARLEAALSGRPDVELLASDGGACVYALDQPGWLSSRTLPDPLSLVAWSALRGEPGLLVDGVAPPEGASWEDSGCVAFRSARSWVTLALPPGPIGGLAALADNDDAYCVEASADGQRWEAVGELGPRDYPGVRLRVLFAPALDGARYVRLSARGGDGLYALCEVRAIGG